MIDDVNPFVYSRPVAPEDVVDRDDEVRRLLQNAVGGHYVRLYAPRKYGKTAWPASRSERSGANAASCRPSSGTCR